MKSVWMLWAFLGMIAAGLSGCVAGNLSSPVSTPSKEFRIVATLAPQPDEQENTVNKTTPLPNPSDPYQAGLIGQAKDDLAKRLSIASDQINLVESKPVEWPDGSLGCPQPGMAYTQVMVDGLLIRLQVGEKIYEYHSGGNRSPFLCENPQ